MSYILNEMPQQINKKLVEKCSRAETATIGHIRNMLIHTPVKNKL